jgi:hypothetical protein
MGVPKHGFPAQRAANKGRGFDNFGRMRSASFHFQGVNLWACFSSCAFVINEHANMLLPASDIQGCAYFHSVPLIMAAS